jgi:lambda family phage portal protein
MGLRTRVIKRLARFLGMSRAVQPSAYGSGRLLSGRLLGDMPSIYASPDAYLKGGLREWRAKARHQAVTNPYARQIVRSLEINLIGPQGISLRGGVPTLDDPDARESALDPVRNRLIEKSWRAFCRADSFDLSGVRSFYQFELAIAQSFPAYGGCLVRIVREAAGRSRVPISFELLSCEQLDDLYTGQSEIPGRHWRMGIEYDNRTNRRTRYAVLNRHPNDAELPNGALDLHKHTFVDAADIIHVFLPSEIGQTREIPWLLPILTTIQHISEYEQAHWTRKRVTNNMLGFIQRPEPDAPGMMGSTSSLATETDATTGEVISRSSPGQWVELLPGEVPVPPNFGPDDQMYPQVLKTMLRRIASGSGLSYAGLTKDFSDTTYSSSRMSELQDRDSWRTIQQQLISIFHQRVYEEWLSAAIISGSLPIDLFGDFYTDPERYNSPTWIPRSWSFVDPGREMQAYAVARNLGLQSAGDQIAEIYGDDLETVWEQLAYEKQLADKLGLDFATLQPGQVPNDVAGGGSSSSSDQKSTDQAP